LPTKQHSPATEPLSKMSQSRKMSNVLQERLLLSCSTVYNKLTDLAVFIGRHQQDQRTSNGNRITRKWPLDLSSTANEVRAFRTVFLFDVFDLIWAMRRNMLTYVRDSRMECCQEGSNNLHFNELWKALASLSIVCPKKFLKQSGENIFSQFNSQKLSRFEVKNNLNHQVLFLMRNVYFQY